MVHSARLRSRTQLLGKAPRLGRARRPSADQLPQTGSLIAGTMSANAIVQRYPQTEVLFRRLQIDRRQEGYESVEELAWRRGVDEQRLLTQLQELAKVFPGSRLIQE